MKTVKNTFYLTFPNIHTKSIFKNLNGGSSENINTKGIKMDNEPQMSEELENLYQEYWNFHGTMFDKDHNPLEIAAILVAQGLTLYKTVLDEEDYNKMVTSIIESSQKVLKLTPDMGILH